MKLENLTVDDITKIAALATGAVTLITKLTLAIGEIVNKSNMPQADKEALIAQIRAAQASIPEWDNL